MFSSLSWKCTDDRFVLRSASSNDWGNDTIEAECEWYSNYSHSPSNLECVLRYCNNPTNETNTDVLNYNFTWNGQRSLLGTTLDYPCKNGYRIEEDVPLKANASTKTIIECGNDGAFIYPDSWPICSETVACVDPGNSSEVTRTLQSGENLVYLSILEYTCDDPRKWIRSIGTTDLSSSVTTRCMWRKAYTLDGTNLECVIHHCRHPHDDPGSHSAPAPEYQIVLKDEADWDIAFGDNVRYECETVSRD